MYYTAGYYLVIPKHEQGTVNGYSDASRTWSVSTYISHVYPSTWGFRWEYSKRQVPKAFKPSEADLNQLHAWIEAEFKQGNYGWPGFFFNQEKALEFQQHFLAGLPQIKLLGVFLSNDYFPAALAQLQSSAGPEWPSVHSLLLQRIPEPTSGSELGFDLLGLLSFGQYEPSSYHVAEAEYQHIFGIRLNEYGLFPNETDCQRVAAYTDTVADEPAVWLPFKVKLFEQPSRV